jgi:hypothetical protein
VSATGDRTLGAIFGLLGAALVALEGLLDLVRGVVYLAVGHGARSFAPFDQALLFLVLGAVIALFAGIGGLRRQDRSLTAGVVLVVIVIAGWLLLGFSSGVLVLLGSIFVLIAGVIFLVAGR